MEKSINFYLLTIRKDNQLYANVYKDKNKITKAIKLYSEKYPLRLFTLTKTFGQSFDLAIAEQDDKLITCLGPKKDIPDNAKNITKCKKKEIDINEFLSL